MRFGESHSPEAWVRAITGMIVRLALIVLLLLGAVHAAGRLHAVITALVVAAILAYIIRPIAGRLLDFPVFVHSHNALAAAIRATLNWNYLLRRRHHPTGVERTQLSLHARRVVATLYVVILMIAGLYYGTRILVNPFVQEARALMRNYPNLQERAVKLAADARTWYEQAVPENTRAWLEDQWRQGQESGDLSLSRRATDWAQAAVRSLAGTLKYVVEIVLLPVLAFYFALDSKQLKHEFVALMPRRRIKEVLRMIHLFNQIMYSYVVGQAILCILAGVVVGLGLWALKMEYWLTLGVLAGVTRAIPIIGPIIGGIPIVLLALISKGFAVALGVLIFFSILHFVESKFIMPLLIGDRMELHAVVIIVVLLIGAEFGGLLGMFFAPPIAAIVRVMVRRYWLRPRWKKESLTPPPVDSPPGRGE